ncbi:MAG: hypothetical protein WCP55_14665 [Lentisphaerota bacterium]
MIAKKGNYKAKESEKLRTACQRVLGIDGADVELKKQAQGILDRENTVK